MHISIKKENHNFLVRFIIELNNLPSTRRWMNDGRPAAFNVHCFYPKMEEKRKQIIE